jgi:hypothetical protein
MSHYVIPESTTTIEYPVSKRRIKFDSKGNVVYDSAKDKDKDSKG